MPLLYCPSMRRLLVIGALLLGVAGCAYQSDAPLGGIAPSPTVTNPSVPAPAGPVSIALSAINGIGATAGKAYVMARVTNAAGRPVGNIDVTFSTTAGSVAPLMATSDALGQAQTTVTVRGSADVTAQAGPYASVMTVTPNPIPDPVAPVPPIFTPIPPPPPVPPPSQPPPSLDLLRVDLSFSPLSVITGVPFTFTANASAEIASAAWEFGDNTTAQTTGPRVTHTYDSPGTRTATVIVRDRMNRSAVASVAVAVAPAVTATVGCAPGSTTVQSVCNLTMYVRGAVATTSLASVAWNWADGVPDPNVTMPSSRHQYLNQGTYVVTATGTLADGQSATAQTTIVVPK